MFEYGPLTFHQDYYLTVQAGQHSIDLPKDVQWEPETMHDLETHGYVTLSSANFYYVNDRGLDYTGGWR